MHMHSINLYSYIPSLLLHTRTVHCIYHLTVSWLTIRKFDVSPGILRSFFRRGHYLSTVTYQRSQRWIWIGLRFLPHWEPRRKYTTHSAESLLFTFVGGITDIVVEIFVSPLQLNRFLYLSTCVEVGTTGEDGWAENYLVSCSKVSFANYEI